MVTEISVIIKHERWQFHVAEGGSEMDSRSIKKLKLEDVTCEHSDPVANPEKESLICRLEAAKATAVFDPGIWLT